MSQRVSGYARLPNESYFTPEWVTEALIPHLGLDRTTPVLEPAAGDGHIVRVLQRHFNHVVANHDADFMSYRYSCPAIVTNPPYGMAETFIAHALDLTEPDGKVAMLLRTDYDHAISRSYLFKSPFAQCIKLRRRVRWIEGSTGSPSFNHSWFLWDWQHKGPPTLAYAP